jgi:hypothetical protein
MAPRLSPPDPRRTGEKIRRGSQLAGRCESRLWRPFAREDARRYMLAAERYERATRAPGRRTGVLGHVGLEVLREMLHLVDYKTGRLEPKIGTICDRIKRARKTVVRAMAALRFAGFLDWVRRYVPTGETGFGVQVKQTSNAYRLSLPAVAERLLGPIFGRKPPVSADLAFAAAQRAHQFKVAAFEDSPLGAAFGRWDSLVRQREFPKASQSATMFILEVARAEKGHT